MANQLNHEIPLHIDASQHHFYITQCALPRGKPALLPYGVEIVSAIKHYHELSKWFCRAYVVMPDHVHLLIVPSSEESISNLMRGWKSYLSRKHKINWQKDFFETRLRSEESPANKAHYMELNPLRANLVNDPKEWKFFGYCHESSARRDASGYPKKKPTTVPGQRD